MLRSDLTSTEYFQYYKQYVDLVEDIDLLDALQKGYKTIAQFFDSIPQNKLEFRYASGKWTSKDILLHLIDTERVFTYRALYFARNLNSDLEGFDENIFAQYADANTRSMDSLIKEYHSVRSATITFFQNLSENKFEHTGIANNNILSVRACGFIICGHEIHHTNVVRERYLL